MSKDTQPYSPYTVCMTSSDDLLYGIDGPGQGTGYYAW